MVVIGSRSMYRVIKEIAERFGEKHHKIRIDFEPMTTDRTVANTRQGLADLGLLGRSLQPDETGVKGRVLGRDAVVFGVHVSNPIQSLPETHLTGLLTRVYSNWRDVGGTDRPIILIGLGEGRSIRDVVLDHFGLRQPQLRPDPSMATNLQVLQALASQPAGLAYFSLAAAESFESRQEIKLLPFHGIPPTMDNIRNRTYPLLRTLLLLTRDEPNGLTKELLEFACSEESHEIVLKHGFVPGDP